MLPASANVSVQSEAALALSLIAARAAAPVQAAHSTSAGHTWEPLDVADRILEASGEALDRAKEALVALARHPREQGAGVSVTRYWKAGTVDLRKVAELKGVDLDRYRGKGREEVRVTVG